jgi:hypothetical protein
VLLAGPSVWVANERSNTVTKLTADGVLVGSYAVGTRPSALAADNAGNIWVANNKANTVMKLSPDGKLIGTYQVGQGPFGLVAAGADVFVSCFFDKSVVKLSGTTGAALLKVSVGDGPAGLTKYGSYYVVANNGSNNLTVFAEDGTVYSTIAVGRSPLYVVANANGYWIPNTGSDTVSKR